MSARRLLCVGNLLLLRRTAEEQQTDLGEEAPPGLEARVYCWR